MKTYYNSTVLLYVLSCQVKMLYTCNSPAWYICLWYTNICLSAKDKNRSVVSVSRIHSKNSKVVNHPKNYLISTPKVVTHSKNTHKNILKVVTTCKISNTIPSQICPYHKDKYCPQYTNKIIKLSVLHVHIIKLSTFQNIVNTTLLQSYPHYISTYPHNNIKLSTPQHLIIHTITHSIQYYISSLNFV